GPGPKASPRTVTAGPRAAPTCPPAAHIRPASGKTEEMGCVKSGPLPALDREERPPRRGRKRSAHITSRRRPAGAAEPEHPVRPEGSGRCRRRLRPDSRTRRTATRCPGGTGMTILARLLLTFVLAVGVALAPGTATAAKPVPKVP